MFKLKIHGKMCDKSVAKSAAKLRILQLNYRRFNTELIRTFAVDFASDFNCERTLKVKVRH